MSFSSMFKWGRGSSPAGSTALEEPQRAAVPFTPRKVGGSGPDALIHSGRYAAVLHHDAPGSDAASLAAAWEQLEEQMALVPAGEVNGHASNGDAGSGVFVSALYVDRFAVTNALFAEFVADGGYDQSDLWPEEAWPHVAQLVDATGYPGPRFWQKGRPGKHMENHPVVGVCWYEANAYAMWAGKRLPSSAEWERCGTWPTNMEDSKSGLRYPWGNSYGAQRANLWSSGVGTTAGVESYPEGCTPNGVYQLIGNVWEWTGDEYRGPAVREGLTVHFDQQMAEIRGGAFDTYFESHATCRFRSGQPLLYRASNVGFRCVVSVEELRRPAESSF